MKTVNSTTPIISARKLTRIYSLGSTAVVGLDGVDLNVQAGQLVVLKGDSGSGKSTLLSLLAGLDRPTSGQLVVGDIDLGQAEDNRLTGFRREVVGMVFQSFNLMPTLSVLENTCLPALLAGNSLKKATAKAMELLLWLNMDHRSNHLPNQLSGGEMQRTAIARALINNPRIVLADEPTGNLDSRNGEVVIELLNDLNRKWATTVVIATHSSIADPIVSMQIRLKDGKIVNPAG